MNLNQWSKQTNNTNESHFRIRLRNKNENDLMFNRKKLDNNLKSQPNRTPSPPKVLLSTNKFYKSLASRPAVQQSVTKSSFTWSQSQPSTRPKTPDCERKLKRLQQTGLLDKFTNIHINKNIPLADEEDDDDHENDEVFISDNTDDSVVEVKSVSRSSVKSTQDEDFEPEFVHKIKAEVAKSQSMPSQYSQRSNGSVGSIANNSLKRKSSNGNKPKSDSSVLPKVKEKVSVITKKSDPNQNVLNKSKSKSINSLNNDNNNSRKENDPKLSRNEVLAKHKPQDNYHKKVPQRRSRSSNARLSSESNEPNCEKRKTDVKSDLYRSKSQSNVNIDSNKQKSGNNSVNDKQKVDNNSVNNKKSNSSTDENTSREKSIRKIKVNNKYYQILNCIGQGGSSKVYQVYDGELQMTLAVKVVDLGKADEQTVWGYKNEITLLCELRKCKRVVRMYDYEYQNNGQLLLVVMEKGDSDLSNVLKSFIDSEEKTSLDPHLIRFYWQEMVKAVNEIHKYGIIHSDLKPVNFILVSGKLKLIDFGIANAIKANYTSVYKETQIGTINYMAPEALQNRSEIKGKTVIKFNCKADIWSLGCILYNLVYGRTPFHDYNNLFQKASAILDPNTKINYPPIDDQLLFDCMKKCLEREPNKRPTTDELLRHRYLSDTNLSSKSLPNSQNASQALLINQINNLTPNRMKQLSQVLEKLSKP